MVKTHKQKGFTLIELLVVIAIIALLLSILMPALNKIKRQARIVVCSSNLHQMAMGINMYAADNKGKYMPFVAHWASAACMPGGSDLRQMLIDYVACNGRGLLFCPAARYQGENIGQEPGYPPGAVLTAGDQVWTEHFFTYGNGWYFIGYGIFAGLEIETGGGYGSMGWDWSNSGNSSSTEPPRISGSSMDVIAADQNIAISNLREDDLYISNHSKGYNNYYDPAMDLTFITSNTAYGDGHVEKHNTLDHWVYRDYSTPRWFMY